MKYEMLASLIFGQAHMIEPGKLNVILRVLSDRMGIGMELPEFTPALEAATKIQAANGSGWTDAGSGIGVLSVGGTLVHRGSTIDAMSGLTSYKMLSAQFDDMLNSSHVKHIVLDMNSPGGSVNGLFDFADEIYQARGTKPITAIIDESAYSAGYAIASAADEIIIPRTGGVGSIGVVAAHMDRSAANETAGLKVTYVYAGANKVHGNPDNPLSEAAHAELQNEVNRVYDMFVETVARNRGLSTDAVRKTEAGVFRGAVSVSEGLADKVMTAKDAIRSIVDSHRPSNGHVQRAATAARIRSV